jgi:putative transposase
VDQALDRDKMEAHVAGVSSRKDNALMGALNSKSRISKSQVSRLCAEIDLQVQKFLNRPLKGLGYAYLYLVAMDLHGRLGRAIQVTSRGVEVAMGDNADSRRELHGLKGGDSEGEGFWSKFIGYLKEIGLTGVKLNISDAHSAVINAIRRMLQDRCWLRGHVNYASSMFHSAPKEH